MVRVLLVDDSATARALVGAILRSDAEIEVVGEARDGAQGLELTKRLRPNLVLMDFQMPRLDGFEATRQIMSEAPTPIVVMSGTLDTRDVMVSMDAMRAGALAVVAKPPAPQSPEFERECRYLLSTIKAMAQVRTVRRIASAQPLTGGEPLTARPRGAALTDKKRLVALAASTGGPAALHRVLTELPASFPVPILAVQHIALGFAEGLAGWLDKACKLTVKVAQHGEILQARTVYLSPDNRHLGVGPGDTILISDGPPIGGFRPSGNFLFESVARHVGAAAVGLIMTGMGDDGVAGLRQLRDAGGAVLAQDEESSVVFGMPRAAIQAGLPDQVVPLALIAARLTEFV